MTTAAPDLFTNVHKGIRQALFTACVALGRAGDDPAASAEAKALLRQALHFVAHHGDNEDLLLLPLLEQRLPDVFARLRDAHHVLAAQLTELSASVAAAPTAELYLHTCRFVASYLQHMDEEERQLDPAIRRVVPREDLADFGRQSVERTAPADQVMMLGWMIPAMTAPDAEALLARLPAELRERLQAKRPGALLL